MSAQNGHPGGSPLRVREPGREPRRRVLRPALFLEIHRVVRRAETQPSAGIDDDAQAVVARQLVVPSRGLVAVELPQEIVVGVRRKNRFDLARENDRLRRRPRRKKPRVHHEQLAFEDNQRLPAQPREQFVAVGGFENRGQRVATVRRAMPCRDDQQVEVMIAEHGGGRGAERLHGAQDR